MYFVQSMGPLRSQRRIRTDDHRNDGGIGKKRPGVKSRRLGGDDGRGDHLRRLTGCR